MCNPKQDVRPKFIIYTPRWDDGQPYPFHMGLPMPTLLGSWYFLYWKILCWVEDFFLTSLSSCHLEILLPAIIYSLGFFVETCSLNSRVLPPPNPTPSFSPPLDIDVNLPGLSNAKCIIGIFVYWVNVDVQIVWNKHKSNIIKGRIDEIHELSIKYTATFLLYINVWVFRNYNFVQ